MWPDVPALRRHAARGARSRPSAGADRGGARGRPRRHPPRHPHGRRRGAGVRRHLPVARPRVPAAGAAAAQRIETYARCSTWARSTPGSYAELKAEAASGEHAADRRVRDGPRHAPRRLRAGLPAAWSSRRRPASPTCRCTAARRARSSACIRTMPPGGSPSTSCSTIPAFLDWIAGQEVKLIGFRAIREAYRELRSPSGLARRDAKPQGSHADPAVAHARPVFIHADRRSCRRPFVDRHAGPVDGFSQPTVAAPARARGRAGRRRRHRPRRARLRAVHRDGHADQVAERRLPGATSCCSPTRCSRWCRSRVVSRAPRRPRRGCARGGCALHLLRGLLGTERRLSARSTPTAGCRSPMPTRSSSRPRC